MDCEINETKYEANIAAALQQASTEKVLKGDTLVPSDQMIPSGGQIAGAAVDQNVDFKLSRKEKKMILNLRKDRETDDDDNDDNHGKKKRSREEYMSNYGNTKKPNYDKSHHNVYHKEKKSDKDRECVICKMNNHWTHDCKYLSQAQGSVSDYKNRYRYDNQSSSSQQNSHANYTNHQGPILSPNPLTRALTNLRSPSQSSHRVVFN